VAVEVGGTKVITDVLTKEWAATGDNLAAGLSEVFNAADTNFTSVTPMSDTKAIVVYQDYGNSYYGTAVPLTLNPDGTITTGSKVVFNAATTQYISVTALSDTKAIVVYQDYGNSSYGTAVPLTLNPDGTITTGSEVVFNAATTNSTSVTALSDTQAIVVYRDYGNSSYGTAVPLTLNPDGTITAGSEVVFNAAATNFTSVTPMSDTKAIVVYRDNGNSDYGTAVPLTLNPDGTITAGSEEVFNAATTNYTSVTALSDTKAIVVYRDYGNSSYGTAVPLTLNPDGTITAGSEVVFNAAATYYTSVTALSDTKAIVVYRDYGNSDYGTAVPLTLNPDGTLTTGSEEVFNAAATYYTSVTALSDTKAIVVYSDGGNSDYGTVHVLNFDTGQATLTISDQGSVPTEAMLIGTEDVPGTLTYDVAVDTFNVGYEEKDYTGDGARTLQVGIDNVKMDPKLCKLNIQLQRNY
jgi:hypothetical protein